MEKIADMFFIAVFIVGFIAITLIFLLSGPKDNGPEVVSPVCEHEFVTTSKYDWIRGSYKTYSVCTKCGYEV